MFREQGSCYVVFPRHVADRGILRVVGAAPASEASGVVTAPFWSGVDLAYAQISGMLTQRCLSSLDDLDRLAAGSVPHNLLLERISPTGEVTRDPLDVQDWEFLTFTARLSRQDGTIAQGTSGAFAFDGDIPVGMALESTDGNSATFMHASDIYLFVRRHLGRYFAPEAASVAPEAAAPEPTLDLQLVAVGALSLAAGHEPERLFSEGSYAFDLAGPNRIVLATADGQPHAFRSIALRAETERPFTPPRDILLEFSPTADGRRFLMIGRYQVGQDGAFATPRMIARSGALFRVTILNAWDRAPIALDWIRVR
ncbi:MAG: hypothetical protein KDK12_08745 [Rhodobacteraceae bacterium]|nr:hypothetical protein [Paracoccaceae bacterium]